MRRLGGNARGLSYIELLMVVALIGVLTAVVLPTGITLRRASKERQLRRALETIRLALDRYHCDWIRGCIESEDEAGWPLDLEELTEGVEFSDEAYCKLPCGSTIEPPDETAQSPIPDDEKPPPHVYLRRVPQDPFNVDDQEHDTLGWRARAYDDEPDDTAWGGDNVYDVASGSDAVALDGTEVSKW